MFSKDWCEKVGNILNSLRFISTETIEVIKSADGYEFRIKDLPEETTSSSGGTTSTISPTLALVQPEATIPWTTVS